MLHFECFTRKTLAESLRAITKAYDALKLKYRRALDDRVSKTLVEAELEDVKVSLKKVPKFRSVEALVDSYLSLQRRHSAKCAELADLKRLIKGKDGQGNANQNRTRFDR